MSRANWVVAGSDPGAERAALLYSVMYSCRLHDIDPWAYVTDVLGRIATHPASRVTESSPRAWPRTRRTEPVEPSATDDLAAAG